MRILRAAVHRAMPWKNGGGTTVEIVAWPQGAGMDEFDWRLSMATVSADGPFSLFPGIDRTLAVLDGEGIALAIDGDAAIALTPESQPLPFPADRAATARLIGGPVLDLNIMTRRGRFRHAMTRLKLGVEPATVDEEGAVLLFCAAGEIIVETDETTATLGKADTALLPSRPFSAVSGSIAQAVALLVVLTPAD